MRHGRMTDLLLVGLLVWTGATAWADVTPPDIVKGSKIMGKSVQNLEGKVLGEIEDLAIDELDGGVRYAVLSFGGLLGVGEKYIAIPWEALTLSDDHQYFVVDVAEQSLKQAPGFDKNQWPDFADPAYYVTVYDFYHVPVPNREESGRSRIGNKPESRQKGD